MLSIASRIYNCVRKTYKKTDNNGYSLSIDVKKVSEVLVEDKSNNALVGDSFLNYFLKLPDFPVDEEKDKCDAQFLQIDLKNFTGEKTTKNSN